MDKQEEKPVLIVGVGASAGGLEALERLFSGMPLKTGMSFIIIQHLSPDHKSMMVELLSKKTQLKVHQIEENMKLRPDSIYLIPPRYNVLLKNDSLHLEKNNVEKGLNRPIDQFFISLAEQAGEDSAAIILSGTGSDGMRGIRSIKEAGGLVMVQSSESAKFDGMPESALSTGLADYVQAPEDLQEQLVYYSTQPKDKLKINQLDMTRNQSALKMIFSTIQQKTKLDFSEYKLATVLRRIERRIVLNQLETLEDYHNLLQRQPKEVMLLSKELLIGVTSFFRDPEVFKYIEEELFPEILQGNNNRDFRFWIAGCSSGEEAYSYAIILKEYQEKHGLHFSIKIFATDVDSDAITRAAAGFYPEGIAADIPFDLLNKHFIKKEEGFQINRNIREMVVFAQHNLISDPPFTNIDFISCRNMLIYFKPQLQQKVFKLFNFSLSPGGTLQLGMSESMGEMSSFYKKIHSKFKIFQSQGKNMNLRSKSPGMPFFMSSSDNSRQRSQGKHDSEKVLERMLSSMEGIFYKVALIANEHREIIYSCGAISQYFTLPSGRHINDVVKMAVKELSLPVTMGLQRVFRSGKEQLMSNLTVGDSEGSSRIWIRFVPIKQDDQGAKQTAIYLGEMEKLSSKDQLEEIDGSAISNRDYQEMERELNFTRENLQTTIEELETSNEELQATNEELLASNEELQSTNEELQSTNEELHTVNSEYQSRIIELTELNNDVDNLLASTQIYHMILDENGVIRKFSQGINTFFNVLDDDIGRPLNHFGSLVKGIDVISKIEEVKRTNRAIELEFTHDNKKTYLMKIFPYFIGTEASSGMLISFVDISTLSQARDSLGKYMEMYSVLFQSLDMGVVLQDQQGLIVDANPAAGLILGVNRKLLLDRKSETPDWKAVHPDGTPFAGEDHPAMVSLKTGEIRKNVIMGIFHPVKNRTAWIKIHSYPIFSDNRDLPSSVFSLFEEIPENEALGNTFPKE